VENLHHTQGNRNRKIVDQAVEIIATSIQKHWATPKRKRFSAINGEVRLLCRESGIEIPSIKTLYKEIIRHKTHKALVARLGDKAAYSEEPEYLVLDYTTPRHGTRPFHIGHIDHTPVDLVLLDKNLEKVIKSLWLTFLIDAYSRKILAFYLSYDSPSYRTNMMILRECVRRHGRLPKFVVVDGGPDFNCTYFELALAQLKTNKKERPGGKARHGSLIERVFKTTQEQFFYSLSGNTQAYENFRQISPEVDPVKYATWSLERLRVRLGEYLENVYHKNIHGTLGCSPDQIFMEGLTLSGNRAHTLIPYNQNFLIMTCPTTDKGTACVTQHGVKINYLFYRAPVFSLPGMKGLNVPVRYEPFNRGIAYAYVNNQWYELYSEHYAIFKNYSEKAIRIASEYLHLMARHKDRSRSINAERLAAFLRSTDGEELLQTQLRRESESLIQHDAIVSVLNPAPKPELRKAHKTTPAYSAPTLLEDF
jgi:transposase InsO family protein